MFNYGPLGRSLLLVFLQVKLASVGYMDIDNLSNKFKVLYGLCEEQLSKQRHYDFGLRNILSVLRTAGATKRSEPDADEEMLLMRYVVGDSQEVISEALTIP